MTKYLDWIKTNVPQDPNDVLAQCTTYVPLMHRTFPELIVCKGVVYSEHNVDNYVGICKEYLHMWLTHNGIIIDPTKHQFHLIEPLIYKEFPASVTKVEKCHYCGRYYYDFKYQPHCSKECEEK